MPALVRYEAPIQIEETGETKQTLRYMPLSRKRVVVGLKEVRTSDGVTWLTMEEISEWDGSEWSTRDAGGLDEVRASVHSDDGILESAWSTSDCSIYIHMRSMFASWLATVGNWERAHYLVRNSNTWLTMEEISEISDAAHSEWSTSNFRMMRTMWACWAGGRAYHWD